MNAAHTYGWAATQYHEHLQQLSGTVVQAVPVQNLWLLGLAIGHTHACSLFATSAATCSTITHAYLLVLVGGEDEHTLHHLQDKIEAHLQKHLPATVIVLTLARFTAWLLEGHPFAATVHRNAILLYQQDGEPLPVPPSIDQDAAQKERAVQYAQAAKRVESFFAGAELYKVRKEYGMAAFMLHQVAEQSLRAILLLHTGYRANTHSIERLLRCCSLCCPQLLHLRGQPGQGKHHWTLLQGAYIGARYKHDYAVGGKDVAAIGKDVGVIKQLLLQYRPG